MAGFATYDSIISAITVANKGQALHFAKYISPTTADVWRTTWYATGIPPAGSFGTLRAARQIDNTYSAAIPFVNATSPAQAHLLTAGFGAMTTGALCLLYDRLLEAPFDGTTALLQTFDDGGGGPAPSIPARDADGHAHGNGVFMFLESVVATTSTRTYTITYTNQAGVGGRSTSVSGIALAANSVFNCPSGLWTALQTGDTGVRSVQTIQLSAAAGANQCNIVLCRPLAYVWVPDDITWEEVDLVLQYPNMPRLYDGTALSFLTLPTASGGIRVHGRIMCAEA